MTVVNLTLINFDRLLFTKASSLSFSLGHVFLVLGKFVHLQTRNFISSSFSFEVFLGGLHFLCNVIWQVWKWILWTNTTLLSTSIVTIVTKGAKKNSFYVWKEQSVNRKIVLTREKIICIQTEKGCVSQKPHVPHPPLESRRTHPPNGWLILIISQEK